MSHEGIRILTEEQSRRAVQAERPLTDGEVTPAKIRVEVTAGTGLAIDWKDGHRSHWTFPFLREACPCATCHEQREADGRKPGQRRPAPASLLPMYTPPARPLEATPVGRYAIKFKWADGHESGIYAWEYLRRLDEDSR